MSGIAYEATPSIQEELDGFRLVVGLKTTLLNGIIGPIVSFRDYGVWPLCREAAVIMVQKLAQEEVEIHQRIAQTFIQECLGAPK